MTWRQAWGEDRVYFHDEAAQLCSFPTRFTSLAPPDPFVVLARGRSYFRIEDLIQLAKLVQELWEEQSGTGAKEIMP
ncbi:Y4bD/Y4pK family protein [Acidobacteria bacterium AH-259-L09]|nr:Y4bD/Y4pK family protein [Acidobacteria bacterium AH-259-L09]